MKRVLRIWAFICTVVMLLGVMCGCSAFIEGFMEGFSEGYNEAMQGVSGQDEPSLEEYAEYTDGWESPLFTPQEAADLFSIRDDVCNTTDIIGRWEDSEGGVIEFYPDGSAYWFGTDTYGTYTFDGQFLCLYKDGEETKYPARLYGTMFVFFPTEYHYYFERSGEGSGLIGHWDCVSHDEGYTFDFREDGTFTEDNTYNGVFYTDGNDILLSYDDATADICLYVLDGDNLAFAYGHLLEFVYTPAKD